MKLTTYPMPGRRDAGTRRAVARRASTGHLGRHLMWAPGLLAAAALWIAGATAPAPAAAQAIGSGFEPNPNAAITQVGTRGANFLRIGPTARARALAEPGVALLDGAGSLYYNPAAAALTESLSAVGSVTRLYGDDGVEHAYLAAVVPIGSESVVGVHTLLLNSGNLQPTREITPYGADPLRGDYMEWRSLAIGATFARRITDRLALGATGKIIQEGLDFAKAQWVAMDLGLVFETGMYGVRLGMAIQHLGSEGRFEGPGIYHNVSRDQRIYDDLILGSPIAYRYDTEKMVLPTTFRMGIEAPIYGTATSIITGSGPHALNLLGEVNDGFDTAVESRWGIEYSLREMFFLRAGRHFMSDDRRPSGWGLDGYTFGAGVSLPIPIGERLTIDYAYAGHGVLDNVQTFTVQVGR